MYLFFVCLCVVLVCSCTIAYSWLSAFGLFLTQCVQLLRHVALLKSSLDPSLVIFREKRKEFLTSVTSRRHDMRARAAEHMTNISSSISVRAWIYIYIAFLCSFFFLYFLASSCVCMFSCLHMYVYVCFVPLSSEGLFMLLLSAGA